MSSMYTDEAEELVSLWSSIKQFITAKEREDAAESFLKAAEEIYNVEDMVKYYQQLTCPKKTKRTKTKSLIKHV